MDAHQRPGIALTTFDTRTAQAVVAVLRRAGIGAWTGEVDGEETEVMVSDGRREDALRTLGARMEEVRQAAVEAEGRARPRTRREDPDPVLADDPDDAGSGPPLVMERLRSFGWLAAVVLVPLMVVALAPTLRGDVAIRVLIGIAVVVIAVIVLRRRR